MWVHMSSPWVRLAQLVVVVVMKDLFHLLPVPGLQKSQYMGIQEQQTPGIKNRDLTSSSIHCFACFPCVPVWIITHIRPFPSDHWIAWKKLDGTVPSTSCNFADTVRLLLQNVLNISSMRPSTTLTYLTYKFHQVSIWCPRKCPTPWRNCPAWLSSWKLWNAVAEHVPKVVRPRLPGDHGVHQAFLISGDWSIL